MRIFPLVVCLLSMSVVTALAQPAWFSSPENAGYSSAQYMLGTGSGPSASEALTTAQQSIASQLRVSIESKVETFTQEIKSSEKEDFLNQYKSSATAVVSETVTGIQIAKQEEIAGTTYVLVVLDRQKYLKGLRSELDNLSMKISGLVGEGKSILKNGKPFSGLELLLEAQDAIDIFFSKRALYDAMNSSPYQWSQKEEAADVMPLIKKILSDIRLEVSQGDKQTVKIGMMLPNPIQFKATMQYEGKKLAIQQLPMVISYDNGSLIERGVTKDDGTIDIWVKAIPSMGEKGKVTAVLNPYKLLTLFRKYVDDAKATASFTASASSPMAFSLTIKDEQGGRVFDVEKKFSFAIEKMNHRIVDKAILVLDGIIKKTDVKQIDGMKGPQFLTTCEVVISLGISITGEKIGSMFSTAQGLADSEEKSLKAAIGKVMINPKEFAEMISQSEDGLKKTYDKISADAMKSAKAKYSQGNLTGAIAELVNVISDDNRVAEASKFMEKIRLEINRKEEERITQEEKQKELSRQKELEKARLYAEVKKAEANAKVELEKIRANKTNQTPAWLQGIWVLSDSNLELRLNKDQSASITLDGKKMLGRYDVTNDKIYLDLGQDGIFHFNYNASEKIVVNNEGKIFKKK
jgi:hypothetical protein